MAKSAGVTALQPITGEQEGFERMVMSEATRAKMGATGREYATGFVLRRDKKLVKSDDFTTITVYEICINRQNSFA